MFLAPTQLKSIIRETNPRLRTDAKHKEVAWKSDYTLLAIGMEDGYVNTLDQ